MLALGTLKLYAIAALVIVAALVWYRFDAVQDGYNSAVGKITAANQIVRDAADKARLGPDQCQGTWNRDTGKCE